MKTAHNRMKMLSFPFFVRSTPGCCYLALIRSSASSSSSASLSFRLHFVSCIRFLITHFCMANQVEYETVPGWKQDITSVRSYQELPVEAQHYVERIEELLGLSCQYIGVGPGRDALILKE